jgi:kumamolisin
MNIKPYVRRRGSMGAAASHQVSYTPDQIAALYQFPKVPTGPDQTIALIELGGGYRESDITHYFSKLGLPAPKMTAVGVAGGKNAPGVDQDSDGEVMLDVLVAAAAYSYCTGTAANILVFFAPNDVQTGFADAIKAAAAHSKKPSVCSISWGAPENHWTEDSIAGMEAAFTAANEANMTVLVAAGDNGSGDGERGHHVDYPASSPQVIGCGGTSLHAAGTTIVSEMVWHDGSQGGSTGGGYSTLFARPKWQTFTNKMRGVPDLAGDADPVTGYVVVVDGTQQVIGGTSAVAPLMAGLVAALCRHKGRPLGFLNPELYRSVAAFRDISIGNNGAFSASSGWDAATGLGVPVGAKLVKDVSTA